jgi:hypothetical protein
VNERLQNLAREAGYFEFNKWDYFDINKFAELVVNDIIEIMSDPVNYNRCTFTTFDESQAKCVASELATKINQHFGIEK